MGSAVGIPSSCEEIIKQVSLKGLPDAIEEAIYMDEKFPLVLDPTQQASRFLKYQTGAFIDFNDPTVTNIGNLNRALVSSVLNGRTLTLKIPTLEGFNDTAFQPKSFPKELIDKSEFFKDEVWKLILDPKKGDPAPEDALISSEFVFIICTNTEYIPPTLKGHMKVIKVIDISNSESSNQNEISSGDAAMDQIASMYGASEIIRNSLQLVEAAFDGELEEMKNIIQKGYHLESCDGRKHTALSEASSQGHIDIVKYLLENGADPNSQSDTGRSPLWRAAFNGHIEVVKILLEAGANPQFRDKVSMESAFDIASKDEVREILNQWNIETTYALIDQRKKVILENLEKRIKTSAERELFARNILRKELTEKAEQGDIQGIKEILTQIADEAVKSNTKPRATAEVRNEQGQSLLSIAAQHDNEALADFLLKYWKEMDVDRWDLLEGEISEEAKIFKTNPNSRDLKGWTCVCIAVFHDSKKVLRLLLEHGGDPNIRSSYNKNAWDLAKDELDAAEKVVRSRAEIRQVLNDFDKSTNPAIFAKSSVVKSDCEVNYKDLDENGSATIMNIEMNQELNNQATQEKEKKKTGKTKGNAGGAKAKSTSGGKGGKKA